MSIINDYSQHGEGKIISDYFGDFKGHLISLGENDGKTLSNVLGLIEADWSADLVEPSKQVFGKLCLQHAERNKVKCWEFGIADKDGTLDFYESGTHLNNGDLSLLSSSFEKEIKKWEKETFKKTNINVFTWESFLNLACVKHADLISIDCEGQDWNILTQIDFEALQVKCVCVEYNNTDKQKYINHMAKYGFKLHFSNFCNLIFVK